MQCFLNLTVVVSKRQVRWFRHTENVTTQTLKTPTPGVVFNESKVLFDFHPRSAEYCKVCHLYCWQLMFPAFWWGPTLCFLVEVNALFLMRNCALLLMIDKSYSFFLHYVTKSAINSTWTQAAIITVRIVAERGVLSAWQDRSDVWQRHRRLLFPLCPEIQEIASFVDVLICYPGTENSSQTTDTGKVCRALSFETFQVR